MMRWFDGLRLFQNQSHLLLRPRVIQFTNRDAAVDYGIPTGRVKAERWATPKKGSEGEREAPCIKLGQLIVKRSQMSRVVVHNGASTWRMGHAGMKGKKEQMVVGPLGRTGPRAKRRGSGRWVGRTGIPHRDCEIWQR